MAPILARFFILVIVVIVIVLLIATVIPILLQMAFGQETKAPPAVTPTPVPTPTPTQPNPNFQYLPQKAAVTVYNPEIGIPTNAQPLQVVPTVVPQQVVPQSNILDQLGGATGITALAAAAGVYIKAHLVGKKADKTEETTREQSVQIVKGTEVDQSLANRIYKNMPDNGESIHDQPEIKLETLAKNKEEAVKTASKA